MIRKNPAVDVIYDILTLTSAAYPASNFIKSLLFQYQERGGLSKKQLQDLHTKASKVADMPPGKLATLEAVILKKPTRYKSPMPTAMPVVVKDEIPGQQINEILAKYPQHKMVLFLKSRYEGNDILSAGEKAEIERFYKILIKQKA
jgi:hypothetical protein